MSLTITSESPLSQSPSITQSLLHIRALPFGSSSALEGERWKRSGVGRLLSSPGYRGQPCMPSALDQSFVAIIIATDEVVCPGRRVSLVVMVLVVGLPAHWQIMMLIQGKVGSCSWHSREPKQQPGRETLTYTNKYLAFCHKCG